MQQKFIVGQIMEAPHRAFQPPKMLGSESPFSISGTLTDGGETLDQDTGGVSLMDQQDDDAQMCGYRPLEAERNLIDLYAQPNRGIWPRLASQTVAQLTESMHSMSTDPSSAKNKRSAEASLEGATGRRDREERVYTESCSNLKSSSAVSLIEEGDDDDGASDSTFTAASVSGDATAWGTGQTCRALFPSARAIPRTEPKAGDWEAILAQRAADAESNTGADMLKIAWWDPSSNDYDISRFRHPIHQAYFCPFPACEDAMFGNSFECQSDIEWHIKYCHTRTKFRCVECYKHFSSAASLVAHAESTWRCGIKESGRFNKVGQNAVGIVCFANKLPVP